MLGDTGMAEKDCVQVNVNEYVPPTLREQLQKQREGLMTKVNQIDEALKLMDSTPDYERVHDAIVRVQQGRLR